MRDLNQPSAGFNQSFIGSYLSTAAGPSAIPYINYSGPVQFQEMKFTEKEARPTRQNRVLAEIPQEHLEWIFNASKRNVWLKNSMALVILGVVSFLVCFGCILSFKELILSASEYQPAIEFSISGSKISVNSNIVGIVILIISFLFFLTYIKHVFKLFTERPWFYHTKQDKTNENPNE